MPIQTESDAPAKMVLVPAHLLVELENSRQKIYALHTKDNDPIATAMLIKLVDITEPMWKLANTKWKEAK